MASITIQNQAATGGVVTDLSINNIVVNETVNGNLMNVGAIIPVGGTAPNVWNIAAGPGANLNAGIPTITTIGIGAPVNPPGMQDWYFVNINVCFQ